ncbi:MAG: Uncharacterised protein [Cellulomonadaceae bacterium TMED98]|nr:MAG: Uncharacterised protein [Cellulomonadaceae bacterium TMED98]
MHLGTNRPHAHRPGVKPLDNRLHRLDLVQGNRCPIGGAQGKQSPEGHQFFGLVIHLFGVLAEDVEALLPRSVLQQEHRFRVEQVGRPLPSPLVFTANGKALVRVGTDRRRIGQLVALAVFLFQHREVHPAEDARSACEVLVNDVLGESDRFERLGSGVGRHGGDSHLAHDLQHALAKSSNDVAHCLLWLHTLDVSGAGHMLDGFHGQVGVDGGSAVTNQGGRVVDFADISRLHDDAGAHALMATNQVVVDRGDQ